MDTETTRMETLTGEAFDVAAKWWADKLRTPPRHDNGDGFQSMLGNMLTASLPALDEGTVQAFEAHLRASIVAAAERGRESMGAAHVLLGVDYDPDLMLRDAMHAAGIRGDRLPWKTTMWLTEQSGCSVKVACGYWAEPQRIWPAEAK